MEMTYSEYQERVRQSIARRFYDYRKRNYLTQKEMAVRMGMTRVAMNLIGKTAPKAVTLRKFAKLEQLERQRQE
jgi:transcriptional regulator with XRE-family HTH domain